MKPNLGKPTTDDTEDTFELDGLDEIDSKFLVPDGDYKMKVTDVVKDVSKAGNPMWIWDFAITAGPEAGKEFKLWTAITAGALWKLVQVLAAIGLHDGKSKKVRFSRSEAIGRECMGTLQQEEYNGRMSSKIDSVRPL
jgi:hypothetical protein